MTTSPNPLPPLLRRDATAAEYATGGLESDKQAIFDGVNSMTVVYLRVQRDVLTPLAIAGDVQGGIAADDAQGLPLGTGPG